MAGKDDLVQWLLTSLSELGGSAHHVLIARRIWQRHEEELRKSGDLFYTWQYDLRWSAQKLRDTGYLAKMQERGNGVWSLTAAGWSVSVVDSGPDLPDEVPE